MGDKKKLLLFCLLISMLSIIGCSRGSHYTFKSIENDTNSSMEMSYSKFNGQKFKSIQLKSGDILNLNIHVKTISGTLSVYVLTEDGNEIYNIANPETSLSEKINISKDGNYKIKLVSDNHSGDYHIDWNV